jgi:hypothetical protein
MSKFRRIVSQLIGMIQCGLGVLASVFAYLIYASPSIRDMLAVDSGEIYLYMFFFLVFGIFSILSGLLVRKEEDS